MALHDTGADPIKAIFIGFLTEEEGPGLRSFLRFGGSTWVSSSTCPMDHQAIPMHVPESTKVRSGSFSLRKWRSRRRKSLRWLRLKNPKKREAPEKGGLRLHRMNLKKTELYLSALSGF